MAFQSSTDSPLAAAAAAAEPMSAAGPQADTAPEDEAPEAPTDDDAEGYGRAEDTPVLDFLVGQIDDINLADRYSPEVLNTLGVLVVSEYEIDENSRADWKDKAEKAMKFALQDSAPKQYPWPGASSIIYPLIAQAAMQFNARTYPAIIQNKSVVKGVVWGSDKGTPATVDGKPGGEPKMHPDGQPVWLSAPGEKRKRADRIAEHMSWQLLDEQEEWETQTDTMLMQLPITGGAIRKSYFDPSEKRNRSLLVSLTDLVWNYEAPSFAVAPRHTEILTLYPHQIAEYERAGMYLPLEYGPGNSDETDPEMADAGDEDAPHVFLEQHRRYDLDGDGYAEPYVVTVHKRSNKVVRIVARYDEGGIAMGKDASADDADEAEDVVLRITPVEHYTLIPFLPNPDGGSYPVGFGHLLRALNEGINTTLNQMFDAGHLQNAGGGFVSDQLSISSGDVNFTVGKYKRVGSKGQAIRDAVFPIPFPGPSPVLFQLLGVLLNAGKECASIQDVLAGDAAMANAPPTTVLALIEQGMKVYTAIHKRVYRALKSEFAKLYRLNRLYLSETQRYQIGDEWREVTPEDYRLGGGVEPIADPTMITDMQKLGRAQILMGFKDDPLINQKEIRQRLFQSASVDRIEDLWAPPDPQAPMLMQIAMEEKSAALGRVRAAELKDNSQAYLNMALAKAKASGPEIAWIEAQLRMMELHIEATNTMVKAADVQAKTHGRVNTQEAIDASRRNARTTPSAGAPRAPDPGNDGTGIPAVAPQPGDGGIPPLAQGSNGGIPNGGGGPPGIGEVGVQ